MTVWTPGRYLQVRRQVAGVSLDQVADQFETSPRIDALERIGLLKLVEADTHTVTVTIAAAYRAAGVHFDMNVLVLLVPPLPMTPPQVCGRCGCSWNDACNDHGRGCSWVAPNLCSSCGGQPGAQAVAA